MSRNGNAVASGGAKGERPAGRLLGSLREALAAASREDATRVTTTHPTAPAEKSEPMALSEGETAKVDEAMLLPPPAEADAAAPAVVTPPPLPSAAEAARAARGGTPNIPPVDRAVDRHVEFDAPPTTRVVRKEAEAQIEAEDQAVEEPDEMVRTERVRGKNKVERGAFQQDPVVGWLVVVGGPGIGSFRPVFEGNNTLGRSASNRIAIDFGDDAISGEEQAYVRYDSTDRSFLFVPNLAKTNVVSVNDQRPAAAVPLSAMDVITMGRTQLVFVPFCGPDFDWSELTGLDG